MLLYDSGQTVVTNSRIIGEIRDWVLCTYFPLPLLYIVPKVTCKSNNHSIVSC